MTIAITPSNIHDGRFASIRTSASDEAEETPFMRMTMAKCDKAQRDLERMAMAKCDAADADDDGEVRDSSSDEPEPRAKVPFVYE